MSYNAGLQTARGSGTKGTSPATSSTARCACAEEWKDLKTLHAGAERRVPDEAIFEHNRKRDSGRS